MHNWKTEEKLYTQKEMDDQLNFFKENIEYLLDKLDSNKQDQYEAVHSICTEFDIQHPALTLEGFDIETVADFIDCLKHSCAADYLRNYYWDELDDYRRDKRRNDRDEESEYWSYRCG